jgi:hypothetical protein
MEDKVSARQYLYGFRYIFLLYLFIFNPTDLRAQEKSVNKNFKKTFSSKKITEKINLQRAETNVFTSPLSRTLFYGDPPCVRYLLAGTHTGYVIGTNDYYDFGKYQRFDFTGDGYLERVHVYFFAKKIVGAENNFTLVVRSVGTNGEPNNLLYSATYSTSSIDTVNIPTTFTISPKLSVSDAFFIGIEWSSSYDDQLAIYADQKGKGDVRKRAWEKWNDGTFHDIYTAWINNGVAFDADLWIAAVIGQIPQVTTLLAPSNLSIVNSTIPTLIWNASCDAVSYRLQVSKDSDFSSTVFDQRNITGTSKQLSGLVNNTIYYWRVNGANSIGTGNWSATWSFTVILLPTAPVAITATAISPTSFNANWNFVVGATGYYLDVSTLSNFTNFITGFNGKDVFNVTAYAATNLSPNTPHYYRVRAYNLGGTSSNSNTINVTLVGVTRKEVGIPLAYELSRNYPNPFNPNTTIKFSIPHSGFVSLRIFNSVGQEISHLVSEYLSAGIYTVRWSAYGFASGVYFYKIITGDFTETKKLILLK